MWLYNRTCAIVKKSSCSDGRSKDEVEFSLSWRFWVWSMASVSCSICTKECSNWPRSGFFSNLIVGWTKDFSPVSDCIFSNQFHSNWNIRCHKVNKSWEERLSLVFSIKYWSSVWGKFEHLQSVNLKSFFLNSLNDFSNMKIGVWFYHSISFLSFWLKSSPSIQVRILLNNQLSWVDSDGRADVKVFGSNASNLSSFEEESSVFNIKLLLCLLTISIVLSAR